MPSTFGTIAVVGLMVWLLIQAGKGSEVLPLVPTREEVEPTGLHHLNTLRKSTSYRVQQWLNAAQSALWGTGLGVSFTSGNRTAEEQAALYAKGRTAPGEIVTNADGVRKKSNHQGGGAVDYVLRDLFGIARWYVTDPEDSRYDPAVLRAYDTINALASAYGLESGQYWRSLFDPYHLEEV